MTEAVSVGFPTIVKTMMACGTNDAHTMVFLLCANSPLLLFKCVFSISDSGRVFIFVDTCNLKQLFYGMCLNAGCGVQEGRLCEFSCASSSCGSGLSLLSTYQFYAVTALDFEVTVGTF